MRDTDYKKIHTCELIVVAAKQLVITYMSNMSRVDCRHTHYTILCVSDMIRHEEIYRFC